MNRIFVYGTLKKGFGNHSIISGSRWLGDTEVKGKIYNLGAFPGAKFDEDGIVKGELYEVNELTLGRLDRLEGHPSFYLRTKVPCNLGVIVEAYHYCGKVNSKWLIESGVWK